MKSRRVRQLVEALRDVAVGVLPGIAVSVGVLVAGQLLPVFFLVIPGVLFVAFVAHARAVRREKVREFMRAPSMLIFSDDPDDVELWEMSLIDLERLRPLWVPRPTVFAALALTNVGFAVGLSVLLAVSIGQGAGRLILLGAGLAASLIGLTVLASAFEDWREMVMGLRQAADVAGPAGPAVRAALAGSGADEPRAHPANPTPAKRWSRESA